MKFLIADDHAIVRKGLVQLINEEFPSAEIIEVSDSIQVLETIRKDNFDLIMLDISMPGKNGIEILKQIKAEKIKSPVLMLSMHSEDQYALRTLKAGASGFLNKDTATEELIIAINKILSGKKYISANMAEKMAEEMGDNSKKTGHENLSDRELQVLSLIASGKTVSEIADEINLSVNTISTYRARILEKLGLNNNAEITRYCFDNDLI